MKKKAKQKKLGAGERLPQFFPNTSGKRNSSSTSALAKKKNEKKNPFSSTYSYFFPNSFPSLKHLSSHPSFVCTFRYIIGNCLCILSASILTSCSHRLKLAVYLHHSQKILCELTLPLTSYPAAAHSYLTVYSYLLHCSFSYRLHSCELPCLSQPTPSFY